MRVMATPRGPDTIAGMSGEARQYEIRVQGRLGEMMLGAFAPLRAHFPVPGETLLRGELADQAALHGVLAQIENLSLELLEVRRVPSA